MDKTTLISVAGTFCAYFASHFNEILGATGMIITIAYTLRKWYLLETENNE